MMAIFIYFFLILEMGEGKFRVFKFLTRFKGFLYPGHVIAPAI